MSMLSPTEDILISFTFIAQILKICARFLRFIADLFKKASEENGSPLAILYKLFNQSISHWTVTLSDTPVCD